jgi:hypothetical protein
VPLPKTSKVILVKGFKYDVHDGNGDCWGSVVCVHTPTEFNYNTKERKEIHKDIYSYERIGEK